MKISGSATLSLGIEEVWRRLEDPSWLARCTPGLVRLDLSSPDHYDMAIELSLPVLRGRFTGTIDIRERSKPERMRLELEGKGAPGFVEGEATLRLIAEGRATRVEWSAKVQMGGSIARVGQRMLSGVVIEMAGEFFSKLGDPDADVTPGAAPQEGRPGGLGAVLRLIWRAFMRRMGLSHRR